MATLWIVPALQPLEDGEPRLSLAPKPATVQHLALERGKETLGHGVIVGIVGGADRSTRRYAGAGTDARGGPAAGAGAGPWAELLRRYLDWAQPVQCRCYRRWEDTSLRSSARKAPSPPRRAGRYGSP